MKTLKKLFWIFIAIAVFALDLFSKTLVLENLILEEPVAIMPMVNLFFTFNTGAAFSLFHQAGGWQQLFFEAVAVAVSAVLIIWQFRIDLKELWLRSAIALILGGTMGNLYDRFVYGKVIDFIDVYYKNWHYPVFNIADAAICIGAFMLIIDIIRKDKKDSKGGQTRKAGSDPSMDSQGSDPALCTDRGHR